MTLNYEAEVPVERLGFDPEEQAKAVIEAVLDDLNCPYEAEVSLLITGPEQIRTLNRDFRQTDKETDVLSFPMNDFEVEGDFSFLEDDYAAADAFNPESGELILGDIVINIERVLTQAQDYGHSIKREFSFLVAHSVLHLCGFDHMEKQEAERMEQKQSAILNAMGIVRSEEH